MDASLKLIRDFMCRLLKPKLPSYEVYAEALLNLDYSCIFYAKLLSNLVIIDSNLTL